MGRWLILLLAGLLFVQFPRQAAAGGECERPRSIWIGATDVTAEAGARFSGCTLAVNATALAPKLNLSVRIEARAVLVRDSSGATWTATHGDDYFANGQRRLRLDVPLSLEGAIVYLPVAALTTFAATPLSFETATGTLVIGKQPQATASPAGWEPLTIEKTAAEKADMEMKDFTSGSARPASALKPTNPPPGHEVYHLSTVTGAVLGYDSGAEVFGSGLLYGTPTDFGAFLTAGPRGLKVLSGRAGVQSRDRRLLLQGGDLFSHVWGLARGIRLARNTPGLVRPSIALYLQTRRDGANKPLAAYSDEFQFHRDASAGGEITSDGAYSLHARTEHAGTGLHAFLRETGRPAEANKGASAFITLGRIGFSGRFSRTGEPGASIDWTSAAARVSLVRGSDLTLDYTVVDSVANRYGTASAQVSVRLSRLRCVAGYQYRDGELVTGTADSRPIRLKQTGLTWAAAYNFANRLTVDVQSQTRWRQLEFERWSQLIATYRLGKRIELDFLSRVPQLLDASQMRAGFRYRFSPTVALLAEFGNAPTYQGVAVAPGRRLWKVGIHKQWGLRTPAAGVTVSGIISDQTRNPVQGAIVRLGPYTAASGQDGSYRLEHVPNGSYPISLDEASLPAEYASSAPARTVVVGRSHVTADWSVSQLGVITGHVYVDANQNSRIDAGEGMSRIAVFLGEHVTATGDDGAFTFFNVPPGPHRVSIDPARLPQSHIVVSPAEVDVAESKPVIEFVLAKKERPIVFQEAP